MADLKKLIGNALNKAKGTKPSDDGYATRKVKGMTVKQGMESKRQENMNATRKAFDIINENKVKSARPGLNTNVPASTKTTKPAFIQDAVDKKNKEQAKFGSTTYSSEKGYSPKRKEEQKSEMKSGLVSGIQKMKSAFQPKNKRTI
jgi:hypothetical protein